MHNILSWLTFCILIHICQGNQLQIFCDPTIYSDNHNFHGWLLPGCFYVAPSKRRAKEEELRNTNHSKMIDASFIPGSNLGL